MNRINTSLLMSEAEYFDDSFAINAHMDDEIPVDLEQAKKEHSQIQNHFLEAGIKVTKVNAPEGCQDGVYAANWALVHKDIAIMANLPNKRRAEEKYAEKILKNLGKKIVKLPEEFRFSGQGDALICGNYLFVGSNYRTSVETHPLLARETGLEVIGVQTIPQLDDNQQEVINPITGWPDSFFYDLDLALAVIKGPSEGPCPHGKQAERCDCRSLIAWCPEAFLPESQERIRAIPNLDKIEVSLEEAMYGFACNLVSTGESAIMSDHAPNLKQALEDRGLTVYTPKVTELLKGGGFIRCTSLTLN